MFSTRLYKFKKSSDSTKTPTTIGVEYQCVLKDNTGLINPVFRFKYSLNENIGQYNFMYIDAFDRFYFIDNWEWSAGEWVAYCSPDPMGTYKEEIKTLRATIERCSNATYQNRTIPDPLSIVSPGVNVQQSEINAQLGDFANDPADGGFFIVGINNGESITGAVAYYALTFKAFYQTVNFLMKQNPFDWNTSLNNKVNPLQYINSVYWCPLLAHQFSEYTPINSIILFQNSIGNGNVSIQLDSSWGQCYAIFRDNDEQKGLIKYLQYTIQIPENSVAEWLATTSYRYVLTAPYTGSFDLPSEIVGKNPNVAKTLYLKYKIQLDTGDAVVAISTSGATSYLNFYKNNILTFNTRVGSNVLYGDRQSNIGDVLFKSMSSLVGSIASGSFIPTFKTVQTGTGQFDLLGDEIMNDPETVHTGYSMGGFNSMGGAMGVLSAIGSFSSNTITRGSSPTYLDAIDYIHLTIFSKIISNTFDSNELGYVCEKNLLISQVVGTRPTTFIKCKSVHVDFDCTPTERKIIESYLLNGFHFEQ